MRKAFLVATLLSVFGFPTLQAEELKFSLENEIHEISTQLTSQQQVLSDHEARLTQLEASGGGFSTGLANGNPAGWTLTTEALFFAYHRADGVHTGGSRFLDSTLETNHLFSPRVTLSHIGEEGVGVRVRWWEYDRKDSKIVGVDPFSIDVNALTADLEIFGSLLLNDQWSLEMAGGVRYTEFNETLAQELAGVDIRQNVFRGLGGLVGLQVKRRIRSLRFFDDSSILARIRNSISANDKFVGNTLGGGGGADIFEENVIVGTTELALVYEAIRETQAGLTLFVQMGVEWQQWHNYTSGLMPITGDDFNGSEDAGFFGYLASFGVRR